MMRKKLGNITFVFIFILIWAIRSDFEIMWLNPIIFDK